MLLRCAPCSGMHVTAAIVMTALRAWVLLLLRCKGNQREHHASTVVHHVLCGVHLHGREQQQGGQDSNTCGAERV